MVLGLEVNTDKVTGVSQEHEDMTGKLVVLVLQK